MGVNYYFKEGITEKYLLLNVYNDVEEHIHGEYADLKSLSTAMSWLRCPSFYTYKVKKVRVTVEDINMSDEEKQYINDAASKKNINLK